MTPEQKKFIEEIEELASIGCTVDPASVKRLLAIIRGLEADARRQAVRMNHLRIGIDAAMEATKENR